VIPAVCTQCPIPRAYASSSVLPLTPRARSDLSIQASRLRILSSLGGILSLRRAHSLHLNGARSWAVRVLPNVWRRSRSLCRSGAWSFTSFGLSIECFYPHLTTFSPPNLIHALFLLVLPSRFRRTNTTPQLRIFDRQVHARWPLRHCRASNTCTCTCGV
jgi:hypothetical protein